MIRHNQTKFAFEKHATLVRWQPVGGGHYDLKLIGGLTLTPVHAQYYYPPPGYGHGYGYGYGYGYRTWNGYPRGWTVQGGNCAPYKGPGGGGWNTPNGCPPGYTVQGGNCAPYRYGR